MNLSKSKILAYRQCPKRLWLQVNRPELATVDKATVSRMNRGSEVGKVARNLYPGGILIKAVNLGKALSDTALALREDNRKPIFEGALQAGGVLVRADILLPDGNDYRMVEVKSSTSVKPYHVEDSAIQTWVARQAGLCIKTIEISHIDTGFVYPGGGQYEGLFKNVDVTSDIVELEQVVPAWITGARETLAGQEPNIEPGDQCGDPFDCPFIDYCSPVQEGYPPEILPHGKALAAKLRNEGFTDLRQVPAGRLTKPKHLRIWRTTMSGKPELALEAGDSLRSLGYPRYFIDFETIQFAIPIWAGSRPYQQIPFQWSCHEESASGDITHYAWLADGDGDPLREFAESLLDIVGHAGPILVYNAAFERSRMLELAESFPDLAARLRAAVDRIVDLLPITREHYYHPDMRGSWSIKAVLPTIAPELAYADLDVCDGAMAQEAFLTLIDRNVEPASRDKIRNDLLVYCERDTLAMVRLAQFLQDNGARTAGQIQPDEDSSHVDFIGKTVGYSKNLGNEINEEINEVEIILKCRLCSKEFSFCTSEKSIDAWLIGYPVDVFSLGRNADVSSILNLGICKTCKLLT